MKTEVKAIIYLVGIFVILSIGYFYGKNSNKNISEEVVCAQDAFECSDGSFVSRTGPNCEFAMCPAVKNTEATSTTKTFFNAEKKVSFEYPDNFYLNGKITDYVNPVQWPPEITIISGVYNCKPGTNGNSKTVSKKIEGKNYCVSIESEGAAGSTYTTYNYKSVVDKKVINLAFITRMPQCSNFDEPKMTECLQEEKLFSPDKIISPVFDSIKFVE